MDKTSRICESPFTIDWLVAKLREALDDDSSLVDWNAKLIGLGQGFCSNIISVDLKWQPHDSKLPQSIVLKVQESRGAAAGSDEWQNMLSDFGRNAHNTECKVYEKIGNIPSLAVPKIYLTAEVIDNNPGVIVMESFAQRAGFATVLTGLTLAQMLNVADNLAKLHAYCIENKGWENVIDTKIENWEGMDFLSNVRGQQRQFPQFDGLLDSVSKFLDPKFQIRVARKTHIDLGLPPVLVHGDLWSNNLIFSSLEGKVTDKLLAIIDWQTARAGCLMEDISRLLVTNCTNEMRREQQDYVIEFYFEKLCFYLETNPNFGLETVKEAYERMMPISFKWMVLSLFEWTQGTALEMEGGDRRDNLLRAWTKAEEQAEEMLKLSI